MFRTIFDLEKFNSVHLRTSLPLLLLLALGAALSGCGDDSPSESTRSTAKILAFDVSPELLPMSGELTISWSVSGASSLRLLQGDEELELGDEAIAEGSLLALALETTTFKLIATDAKGRAVEALRSVTVEVPGPVIGALDAPAAVEIAEEGGVAPATISWSGVVGATELALEREGQAPLALDPTAGEGSVEVEVDAETRFTLRAANELGEATKSVTVRVVGLPEILLFESDRSRAGTGEEITLSWETENVFGVELRINGAKVEDLDADVTSGAHAVTLLLDSTLELRAYNEVGTEVSSALEVSVGQPLALEFTLSASALWLGETLELSWETEGGNHLTIEEEGAGELLCEVMDHALIAKSGCSWTPAAPGFYSLVLTASNSSGVTTESREVFVGTGAGIERFVAQPSAVNVGEKVDLSWRVHPDPAGNLPSITLVDDRGGTYPVIASEGNLDSSPLAVGDYDFTLIATTTDPRSAPSIAVETVSVHLLPEVDLRASPTYFDDAEAQEVVLSWTTEHAAALVLSRVVEGALVEPVEIAAGDVEQGSWSFVPREDSTYRLVATNSIGGSTDADVTITVAPTEIVSFVATPTSLTQGQPVTLSWQTQMADEVRLDIIGPTYLREEIASPYLDIGSEGGTHLPLTAACNGEISVAGCASLNFPDGFTFPFGGAERSSVAVYTTGVLAFDLPTLIRSEPNSQKFPTESVYTWVHLAPFWDELGWEEDRYPEGNIFYELKEEDGERMLIVQWKDIGIAPSSLTASLNFEVVLWEDGAFEYRYGEISARDTAVNRFRLAGGVASIGFQLPDQSDSDEIAFRGTTPLLGGLAQRTFSYRPSPTELPRSGELVFFPYTGQRELIVALTATRDQVEKRKTLNLDVSLKPTIEFVPIEIPPARRDEAFVLGWRAYNASALTVVDGSGALRCTALNQAQVDEGLCELSESEAGLYRYTVRAVGEHDFVNEQQISVNVFGDFGVHSFTAEHDTVEKGAGVLLSWETFSTDSITLLADGVEIHTQAGTGLDSFLVEKVDAETEFTLIATNFVGVTAEERLTVTIWEIDVEVTADRTAARPGQPIELTVGAKVRDGGADMPVFGALPLVEVHAPGSKFQDISLLTGATVFNLTSSTNQKIELPFAFPYQDKEFSTLWATVHGYISFSEVTGVKNSNTPLPSSANHMVDLAPFWDWLTIQSVAKLWTAEVDNTFVVQWKNMSMGRGSSPAVPNDLNFQVVLFRDGSFEFRYGVMDSNQVNNTLCQPTPDCRNEVAGSAATIGYQFNGGTQGHTFHFGGLNGAVDNPMIFGGLANRTFRYQRLSGPATFTFYPNRTEAFAFCSLSRGEMVCKKLEIAAEFALTSVSATQHFVPYQGSSVLSWESIGGLMVRVKDGEIVLFESSDQATVDKGSFTVSPTRNTTYTVEISAGIRVDSKLEFIEVERVSVTSSASASAGPGMPVTVSWNVTKASEGLDVFVNAPMVETSGQPGTSFYELDLEGDEDAVQVLGANSNVDHVPLPFAGGFKFPYFGLELDSINVGSDGYLTVEEVRTGNNEELPATSRVGRLLFPFWDDLNTRLDGRVYAKAIGSDRYVIQWSRTSRNNGTSNTNQGDLNFMVVLHSDGSFEFRYGRMDAPPLPVSNLRDCNPLHCVHESNASSATIGYQDPSARIAHVVYFGGVATEDGQQPIAGGLANRSWKFSPQGGSGSVQLTPGSSQTHTICALEPVSGEVSCAPTVEVEVPWGIDLFAISPQRPTPGQRPSLSWSVVGLDSFRILSDGVEIASYPVGAAPLPLMGSFEAPPLTQKTTFTLEGHSMQRTKVSSLTVAPRTFDLSATGPSKKLFPGEFASVEWNVSNHAGNVSMVTPMSEIPAGPGAPGAFLDLSQLPAATEMTIAGTTAGVGAAEVALPFSFPYLGRARTVLWASTAGYLSFNAGGNPSTSNVLLPASSSQAINVQMAVFWDGIDGRIDAAKIYSYAPDANTLIVQWSHFRRASGSSPPNEYDLNFQAVLRGDGSFEYRYGEMRPPVQPHTSVSCKEGDCVAEANGADATIGYQDSDGMFGSLLHIGAFIDGDGYAAFPGGLSNRTFAYSPAITGTASVPVSRSGDFQVCGIQGDFSLCESVAIETVADVGELAITELMIDPSSGAEGQWFELRNVSMRALDLQGFEIITAAGSHTISRSLQVPSGSFVTLAASTNVGFTPDYVYGSGIPLARLIDGIEVRAGSASIASVEWGAEWAIPSNQSLSLDSSFHLDGLSAHSQFGEWCDGGMGSPGAVGPGCFSETYVVDPISPKPYLDISTTGTRLYSVEGTSKVERLPLLDGPVSFYGQSYSRLWVFSRGWIAFSDTLPAILPAAPSRTPGTIGPSVSGFWNNMVCDRSQYDCRFFYERRDVGGDSVLILQWSGFRMGAMGGVDFQIQLWPNGDVVVAFGAIDNPHSYRSSGWGSYRGGSALVAVEHDAVDFTVGHRNRVMDFEHRSFHFQKR